MQCAHSGQKQKGMGDLVVPCANPKLLLEASACILFNLYINELEQFAWLCFSAARIHRIFPTLLQNMSVVSTGKICLVSIRQTDIIYMI
jgi:hypothetical protein